MSLRWPKSPARRKKETRNFKCERLRLLGNFHHNLKVYNKKEGNLLVLGRSTSAKVAEDYIPCIYCLGFVCVNNIWHHGKTCKYKPTEHNHDAEELENKNPEEETENHVSFLAKCRLLLHGSRMFQI